MMRRRLTSVALLGLLGVSCWGYPTINVSVSGANRENVRVHIERCSGLRKVPRVDRLSVRSDKPGSSVVCGLIVADRSKPLPLSDWSYGQSVSGFVSTGPCTPLAPGSYRIDVQGSGSGSRVVVMDAQGGVYEKTPDCQP